MEILLNNRNEVLRFIVYEFRKYFLLVKSKLCPKTLNPKYKKNSKTERKRTQRRKGANSGLIRFKNSSLQEQILTLWVQIKSVIKKKECHRQGRRKLIKLALPNPISDGWAAQLTRHTFLAKSFRRGMSKASYLSERPRNCVVVFQKEKKMSCISLTVYFSPQCARCRECIGRKKRHTKAVTKLWGKVESGAWDPLTAWWQRPLKIAPEIVLISYITNREWALAII